MKVNKITEKDIQDVLEGLMVHASKEDIPNVWCEPIGGGMYQTGNCYHGEGFKKDLIKALKEYHERN